MVNLTIRNIPETILNHIRFYATGSRRSVNSELLILLEEGLDVRTREAAIDRPADFSASSRERLWRELCGAWDDGEGVVHTQEEIYRLRGDGFRGGAQ